MNQPPPECVNISALRATPSQISMLMRLGVAQAVAVKMGRVEASNAINQLKPTGRKM